MNGLGCWVVGLHPDLTVGAITCRPFGPPYGAGGFGEPALRVKPDLRSLVRV
jgi:hypothetical protein